MFEEQFIVDGHVLGGDVPVLLLAPVSSSRIPGTCEEWLHVGVTLDIDRGLVDPVLETIAGLDVREVPGLGEPHDGGGVCSCHVRVVYHQAILSLFKVITETGDFTETETNFSDLPLSGP